MGHQAQSQSGAAPDGRCGVGMQPRQLTLPSAFHEFIIMRGTGQQACVQRISISASGTGPAKPPMSWPTR